MARERGTLRENKSLLGVISKPPFRGGFMISVENFFFFYYFFFFRASLMAQQVNNLPAMQEIEETRV